MYPLKAGLAPFDKIKFSAFLSNSNIDCPGLINFSSMIKVSATI